MDEGAALFAAHGGFLFLFSFPSHICARHEADSTRERERERARAREREGERERERETGMHRERGRGRESARACVRAAFGALGICARRNSVRVQVGWGMRES